ncbi:MAG: hypothetical protein OXT09_18385 [Myxococcales bacterium]|nr:hypothetical protein [Myxococcales bacterium]
MQRRPPTWIALALGVTCLGLVPTAAAAADDGSEDVYRYGYQTAIMDVAAAGILTTGLLMDEPSVYWTGAFAYAAGAPMVHMAQKNHSGAFMSVGVRIGAPLLLGLAGGAIAETQSKDGSSQELIESSGPGLLVGGLLAVVIDAQILAVREVETGERVRLRAVPLVGGGRAGAALIGTF